MPNVLLTNICNQRCPYCFAADEFKRKDKQEMSFNDFKKALSFLKKSGDNKVRLIGGEPTLHSQFKKIIDYSLKNNFSIQVFTNGIFSSKIAKFLVSKKDKIKYSFNINSPEFYSNKTWNQINRNLRILTLFKKTLIGSVIWQENFNIDYLLDLANKHFLKAIILRIANPIINRDNKYVFLNQYPILIKNLIKEIEKTDKNRIKIGLGCGFSKKMFSKKQFKVLDDCEVMSGGWGCDGNSGRFDIATDLSIFRCFPLSNWRTKKLFDFGNIQEIEDYFIKFMEEYQNNNSKKDFIHQGPCFAYLLSKKV